MQKKTTTAAHPNKNLRIILIFLIVIALTTVFILGKKQLDPSENVDLAAAAKQSLPPPSPAVQENLEATVKKLEGNWQRTDGGYIIVLKNPTSDGKIDVQYFNPKPIKVGSSSWQNDGGKVIVKIELQDVNYPGSTYTLEYFAKEDMLAGIYYQAVQKLNFDVRFDRIK